MVIEASGPAWASARRASPTPSLDPAVCEHFQAEKKPALAGPERTLSRIKR
jgi:hypothetical protein